MTANLSPVRLLLVTLAGWVNRQQQEVIEYLVEENRVDEFVAHYHRERNHQGLGNRLIAAGSRPLVGTHIRCHERLGGLLRYYHRAA